MQRFMDYKIDFNEYAKKYEHVSKEEMQRLQEKCINEDMFDIHVRHTNMEKEHEMALGKKALRTGPLVHLLSIRIEHNKRVKKVYGTISVDNGFVVHELYDRNRSLPQVLNSDGNLTLNWPDFMSHPDDAMIPMFVTEINAKLFDEDDTPLRQGPPFYLDDTKIEGDTKVEGGYEQVKSVSVPCVRPSLSLVVDYIAIPFGISGRIQIKFRSRNVNGKHDSVNVNGNIVASWVTYGNYPSKECLLFQKDENAFERVEIDGADMLLSRCWVAVPAYSSLVIRVHLSDYDTGENIVNGSVQAAPGLGRGGKIDLNDGMYIQVGLAWFYPQPLGRDEGYDEKVPISAFRTQDLPIDEEMDTEEEDDEPDQPLSNIHRPFRPHKSNLFSSPAIEIFSIFVGRQESKAVQLHGSIEVCSRGKRVCYLFNSNESNENDPLFLSQHMETILVPDGSRLYEDYNDLEIKVNMNMKDMDGNNVAVKGYESLDGETLEDRYGNKQLCCFIRGEEGFLALHYSIFSRAVFACPKVFLTSKRQRSGVYPKVYGSLTCQYRNHFYSNKDYYRVVLFTRTRGDAVELDGDGLLPPCRSKVVVPYYSPLIINLELELECGLRRFEKVASVVEFEIGDKRSKTADISDFTIRIEVDWCKIN